MTQRIGILLSLALAAAVVLVPSPVFADSYVGPRAGYRYDFERQEYVRVFFAETVIVPVLVPATLLVNKAPPASPPPVTISAEALFAEQRRASGAEQVRDATAARLERIEAALERLATARPGPARDLPPRPRGLASAPSQTTAPPARQPRDLVRAAGVLKLSCAQCHTGAQSRGDVQLFDAAGTLSLSGTDWAGIWDQVRRDRMPKGPEKLSPEEKLVIEAMTR